MKIIWMVASLMTTGCALDGRAQEVFVGQSQIEAAQAEFSLMAKKVVAQVDRGARNPRLGALLKDGISDFAMEELGSCAEILIEPIPYVPTLIDPSDGFSNYTPGAPHLLIACPAKEAKVSRTTTTGLLYGAKIYSDVLTKHGFWITYGPGEQAASLQDSRSGKIISIEEIRYALGQVLAAHVPDPSRAAQREVERGRAVVDLRTVISNSVPVGNTSPGLYPIQPSLHQVSQRDSCEFISNNVRAVFAVNLGGSRHVYLKIGNDYWASEDDDGIQINQSAFKSATRNEKPVINNLSVRWERLSMDSAEIYLTGGNSDLLIKTVDADTDQAIYTKHHDMRPLGQLSLTACRSQ